MTRTVLTFTAALGLALAMSGCDSDSESDPVGPGAGEGGGDGAEPEAPEPEAPEPEAPEPEAPEPEAAEPEAPEPEAPEPEVSGEPEPGEWDPAAYAAIVMGAPWADDMVLEYADETLSIADDGIPDRGAVAVYATPNGGTTEVLASAYTQAISMRPVLADAPTDTSLGAIGVTLSGGLMFNPYEGGGEIALDSNFEVDGLPFIDACNGHPLQEGTSYHYHGVPYCITDVIDQEGAHSALLGVLLDGFPIYGPKGTNGMAPNDLDDCNGHMGATPEFPAGIYHYHMSEVAPYSIDCYAGEVAAQGGGQGGPGEMPGGPGEMPGGPGGDMNCADENATMCCGDDVCDGPETVANCAADCG